MALSRPKLGFESRWGRQPSLSCKPSELRLGRPSLRDSHVKIVGPTWDVLPHCIARIVMRRLSRRSRQAVRWRRRTSDTDSITAIFALRQTARAMEIALVVAILRDFLANSTVRSLLEDETWSGQVSDSCTSCAAPLVLSGTTSASHRISPSDWSRTIQVRHDRPARIDRGSSSSQSNLLPRAPRCASRSI